MTNVPFDRLDCPDPPVETGLGPGKPETPGAPITTVSSWSAPPAPASDSTWRAVAIAAVIFLAWLVLFVLLLITPVYLRDRQGRGAAPPTPSSTEAARISLLTSSPSLETL